MGYIQFEVSPMIIVTSKEKLSSINYECNDCIYVVEVDNKDEATKYLRRIKTEFKTGVGYKDRVGKLGQEGSYIRVNNEELAVKLNALFGKHSI